MTDPYPELRELITDPNPLIPPEVREKALRVLDEPDKNPFFDALTRTWRAMQ